MAEYVIGYPYGIYVVTKAPYGSVKKLCKLFKSMSLFKGTVPPDFSPLVFFFKQLLLAPVDKPSNDFDVFRIFAKIFDFSGASPVSLTPAY